MINFSYTYSNTPIITEEIIYYKEEYSFFMPKRFGEVLGSLIINRLTMTLNKDLAISAIDGLSAYTNWKSMTFNVPFAATGIIYLKDWNEGPPQDIWITDDFWDEWVNPETGWVCIGNPSHSNINVMLGSGIVCTLDNNNLRAIWLKPIWNYEQ